MKLTITAILIACLALLSCSSNTPQQYFEKAALNCNFLNGFAGYEVKRELATPSEKLVDEKTMKMAPVTRVEMVKEKLQTVEANFAKVKSLAVTEDTREMLAASTALYEYVLPVYKNEYAQLAALYDDAAAADKIEAMEKSIIEKYQAKFLELYNRVLTTGKTFAAKHNISVREINTTPPAR
jgi:hypothetical protein